MSTGKIIKIDTAKVVKQLLERDADLRDNDNRLIANVWAHQMRPKQLANMCAVDFVRMIAGGSFKAAESITRCRRKLQEEQPELRGSRYHERRSLEHTVRM